MINPDVGFTSSTHPREHLPSKPKDPQVCKVGRIMEIVNLVASVKLSTAIDLGRIREAIGDSGSSESEASWLKVRLKPEDYYVAFYKSGKFLITGLKSVEEAHRIANRVFGLLRSAGIDVDRDKLTVENIVATESLDRSIPLQELILCLDSRDSSYEPEQFPGLVYRKWGVTFLLFHNGKVVITGLRNEKDAEVVLKNLRKLISRLFVERESA